MIVAHEKALRIEGRGIDRGPVGRLGTIEHLKRRFVEQGLEFALERKRRVRPPRKVIFDGVFEARLVALACSQAPPGRKRWTLRLLAEKVVLFAEKAGKYGPILPLIAVDQFLRSAARLELSTCATARRSSWKWSR